MKKESIYFYLNPILLLSHKSLIFIFLVTFSFIVYAQETVLNTETPTPENVESIIASDVPVPEQQEPVVSAKESAVENITLDFKDADIRSVLKIISLKTGVNIIASPEVTGTISIYLDDVPWEKALDVILKTYGFGYEKRANVISVAPLEKLTEQKKMEQELAQVQPTITEVFRLKYIDALDAKRALEPLISSRGRITVLEMTGKTGWKFGGEALGKREVSETERKSLTKTLLITDIPPVLDELRIVLKNIDFKPKQILIEARILEVSRDFLEDIGFEYSTQTVGASSTLINASGDEFQAGGQSISSSSGTPLTPGIFASPTTSLSPETAGMKLILKKILGSKFEVIFRALEEDANSNLLSAPRIMTLDNQEATILIGEKYPILKSTTSESTTNVQVSLDYYQDIGIQLNVVPQVAADNKIGMIIHPAVTSKTTTLSGTGSIAQYPIITTREAETQVLINDGETIVIGGLIKDNVKSSRIGVPLLSSIPFLGRFFRRDTQDIEKIELLIFITARIVDESGLTDKEISNLEEQVSESRVEVSENIQK